MPASHDNWLGTLDIGIGFIRFDAQIGESDFHRHFTIQLMIGIDGPMALVRPDAAPLIAEATLVAANIPHASGPVGRRARALHVEPQHALAHLLAAKVAGRGAIVVDRDEALRICDSATQGADRETPPRIAQLAALAESADPLSGPGDWAAILEISPSRLRAICIEAFGVPPARLRQWGRMRAAARAVAGGASLADAAAASGYADQAHFSRQFRSWFGVSPGRGLASFAINVLD